MSQSIAGRCLCGDVRFTIGGEFSIAACHCSMCRAFHGSSLIAADFHEAPVFEQSESLKWYSSSDWAERGFCGNCGSSMIYRMKGDSPIHAIAVGCLDLPDGLAIKEHIFIDEKPDFYDFADTCPRLTGAQVIERVQNQQSGSA